MIFSVIVTCCVVGFLLWLINRVVPLEGNVRAVMNAGVALLLALWILGVILHSAHVNVP